MRRLAVVLLLTILALVVATPSALAAPPTHERVPVDVDFVDESSYGFPIEIRQTGVSLSRLLAHALVSKSVGIPG